MNTVKPDYTSGWKYKPDYITTNATTPNSITTCVSVPVYLDDEIKRKVNQIYKEREAEMSGISNIQFNDLERELHELGVQLTTIRHSSGDVGCEIEGYLNPDKYKIHRGRERCSVPITPKKPLPKKVIFSGPATTILWKDGTKTTVKCARHDIYDEEVGIAMCYLKKMLGNKGNFNNIFREAMKVAVVKEPKDRNAEDALSKVTKEEK